MNVKQELIKARCRRFAKHCRDNRGFAHFLPEYIEDLLETSEDSDTVNVQLTQLGLKLHPRGGWEYS